MKNIVNLLERIIGYILLAPPLISVLYFLIQLPVQLPGEQGYHFGGIGVGAWTAYVGPNGGATSALPIYFGLMAMAGAYLIKRSEVPSGA